MPQIYGKGAGQAKGGRSQNVTERESQKSTTVESAEESLPSLEEEAERNVLREERYEE